MKVIPVPCLEDNYAYVLIDEQSKDCAVIDPVEPKKVLDVVKKENVTVKLLLTTHHHWDHANGNNELLQLLGQKIPVYGNDERVQGVTHFITNKHSFHLGSLKITPLVTKGHTIGSVSYFVEPTYTDTKCVFTGDTLFSAGCGRFFEGSPSDMHESLSILGSLPESTQVYCGHEYTRSNLQFALAVEPDNKDAMDHAKWASSVDCTIPSTIGMEKKMNPFMRVEVPAVMEKVGKEDPVEVMGALREWKNTFRA